MSNALERWYTKVGLARKGKDGIFSLSNSLKNQFGKPYSEREVPKDTYLESLSETDRDNLEILFTVLTSIVRSKLIVIRAIAVGSSVAMNQDYSPNDIDVRVLHQLTDSPDRIGVESLIQALRIGLEQYDAVVIDEKEIPSYFLTDAELKVAYPNDGTPQHLLISIPGMLPEDKHLREERRFNNLFSLIYSMDQNDIPKGETSPETASPIPPSDYANKVAEKKFDV